MTWEDSAREYHAESTTELDRLRAENSRLQKELAEWQTAASEEVRQADEERKEIERLARRCKAQEALLVCYRIGKQPAEWILRDLEKTKDAK